MKAKKEKSKEETFREVLSEYAPRRQGQYTLEDYYTMPEDLQVVCDRSKVTRRCILGAPDLVMEILSPGTARKDLTVKLNKYRLAGVREYWIIDLEEQHMIVYDFAAKENEDGRYAIYGRDSIVPVRIFDGRCRIGLAHAYEEISGFLKGD